MNNMLPSYFEYMKPVQPVACNLLIHLTVVISPPSLQQLTSIGGGGGGVIVQTPQLSPSNNKWCAILTNLIIPLTLHLHNEADVMEVAMKYLSIPNEVSRVQGSNNRTVSQLMLYVGC